MKQDIAPIRWDLYLSSAAQVVALKMKNNSWAPEQITKLELKNANLTIFHVGDLLNLEHLDLSGNKISNIRFVPFTLNFFRGNGLEQCEKLKWLSLSANLISRRENLKLF
jgi:Leucine-rich repeat (LRR) protein